MSISTILSTATSGLMASQTALRTVSDNVANANTPGYVRKVVDQSSLVSGGAGAGVNVDGIRRVVDRYLDSASLSATSASGQAGALSEMLDRAQGLFGDPSGDDSFFSGLDDAFNQFAALAVDPSSALQRGQAISQLQSFFDDTSRVASSLTQMQGESDTRISSDVERANDLLTQIAKLNGDIRKAKIGGTDSSGSENIQSQLVDELSGLIDVKSTTPTGGGVVLRTTDGKLLADATAAKLAFNRSDTAAGFLTITPANSGGQSFDASFTGGEIVGLLQARNKEIPGALSQLANFVETAAREINRAHNANSAVPAPTTLTGKTTGQADATAFNGFTGNTTIALVNSAGVIQNRVAIAFSGAGAPSISVDGGAATAFTPSTFASVLNGKLTPLGGSASFTNGTLSLSGGANGVAIVDDATTPSTKAGQGFSQFFGLNDLVTSSAYSPDTGLQSTDANGFTPGQQITLRLSRDSGERIRDVTVTVPASPATTMGDLLGALNATGTGVAPDGQFTLDANGRLTYASATTPASSLTVADDKTTRTPGGASISTFFGLGTAATASTAAGYAVNAKIVQNPSLLAVGKVNLAAAVGVSALAPGDGRGATALAQASEVTTNFAAANGLPASSMTLSRYASELAGSLGRKAAAAETAQTSAESVKTEADNRRSSYEGVNIDEELVRLTTYQQSFNASARLVQAASDLYDTLLNMVR